jgi:hypothetical protein
MVPRAITICVSVSEWIGGFGGFRGFDHDYLHIGSAGLCQNDIGRVRHAFGRRNKQKLCQIALPPCLNLMYEFYYKGCFENCKDEINETNEKYMKLNEINLKL